MSEHSNAIQPRAVHPPAAAQPQASGEAREADGKRPYPPRKGAPRFAVTGLFVLAVFYTLYFAREILLPVMLAAIFTLVLTPLMRVLVAARIPQPVAAAIVVFGLLAAFGTGASLLLPPASEWMAKLPETLEVAERKLWPLKRSVAEVSKAAEKVEQMAAPENAAAADPPPPPQRSLVSRILSGAQEVLVLGASTIVLLYFLLATGDMFLRKLVKVLPSFTDKKLAVAAAHTVQNEMAAYLFTITCINAGLGVATGIALYLLGMPNPVLWGVMVGLFNFVPYLGPAVSLIILAVVAVISFDSTGRALAVPGAYFALTFLEGQILTPLITGRRLILNPVVIFLSMLLWGWLWGVVGLLMAVPIAMIARVVCSHVGALQPYCEFLSGERTDIAGPEP